MNDRDNQRRWRADQTGVYEVWYMTWNHPATDQGFWLRFITEVPKPGSEGFLVLVLRQEGLVAHTLASFEAAWTRATAL